MSFIGKAFAPAFLPLFFDIQHMSNGSRYIGAGLNLFRGVSCRVDVKPSPCIKFNFLYGRRELNLPWIEDAVEKLLSMADIKGVKGVFNFNFEVPLNFDLSLPSAALISSLAALHSALKLNIPIKAVIDIAQEIEFKYKIGFGTSPLQSLGGLVLVKDFNAVFPRGFLKIDYPKNIRVVVGSASSIEMLFYPHLWNDFHLKEILTDFPLICDFNLVVEKTGLFVEQFVSRFKGVKPIIDGLKKLDPIVCGLSLNGKLVYAICWRDQIMKFADFLLDFFPCEGIMVFEVDPIGARVYF